jgi:16S rRNA (adenine1518-N6/adenine1519-N6)-dimethyltransferase
MNLCDPRVIRDVMSIYGMTFRKELGQNFLTNASVVEDIADACSDTRDATILEIGPGIGVLTQELGMRYRHVLSVEIDQRLIPLLRFTLQDCPPGTVEVINRDFMKTDLQELLGEAFLSGPVSVCANLPYYITTPILMRLLESGLPFRFITVMVQAEVADRLCAHAGSKDYGAITAVLNYYGEAEKLFRVPAGNFMPAPKVDSAVVRISLWKEKPVRLVSERLFFDTIRYAFEQRRKTLANALSAGFPDIPKEELTTMIAACGHRTDVRGERLDTASFAALSDCIGKWRAENSVGQDTQSDVQGTD